jgi:CRISPR-associated endonuclease Csn1
LITSLVEPWPGFRDEVSRIVDSIIPSHQRSSRIRGALHEETLYGRAYSDSGDASKCIRHVRKSLSGITEHEIQNIVDPRVREIVRQKISEVDDFKTFKKVVDTDPPFITMRSGAKQFIRRVRIEVTSNTVVEIGKGHQKRNVLPGNNHHVEIFEATDKNGKVKWEGRVVTLLEAYERKRLHMQVVDRNWSGGGTGRFLFSLAGGDTIRTSAGIFVVRSFWKAGNSIRFKYVFVYDAREDKAIPREGREPLLSTLKKASCEKVAVDPLGHILPAND